MTKISKKEQKANKIGFTVHTAVIFALILFLVINLYVIRY